MTLVSTTSVKGKIQPGAHAPPLALTGWGIFFISMAVLLLEILITRIFSALMWYHFAFVAVSLAMTGMTIGALLVMLFPRYYRPVPYAGMEDDFDSPETGGVNPASTHSSGKGFQETMRSRDSSNTQERNFDEVKKALQCDWQTRKHVLHLAAESAMLFSLTMVIAICLTGRFNILPNLSLSGIASLLPIIGLFVVPFIHAGVSIALLLTGFRECAGKIYAFDLFGGAAACLIVVGLLEVIDPAGGVLLAAFSAAAGSLLLQRAAGGKGRWNLLVCCVLLIMAIMQQASYAMDKPLIGFHFFKGERNSDRHVSYQRWNACSFLRVMPAGSNHVFYWGGSPLAPPVNVCQKYLDIDATAGTFLTAYGGAQKNSLPVKFERGGQIENTRGAGDLDDISFLKYDVTNFAHYLRKDADVCVIGVGGGRDLLSALAFNQKHVTGVEFNQGILDIITGPYGDFTGHLDRNPRVSLINAEARNYICHNRKKWDIVQASLIDTWAASSAGAFSLSENTLYTSDAWKEFRTHLSERGILSFSRWYSLNDSPVEFYRLVSLAAETLRRDGERNPRAFLLAVVSPKENPDVAGMTAGTLLVSRRPFTATDLVAAEQNAKRLGFNIILSPQTCTDKSLLRLIERDPTLSEVYGCDLDPPDDNRPYFFQMVKPELLLFGGKHHSFNDGMMLLMAAAVVAGLFVAGTGSSALLFTGKSGGILERLNFFLYFLLIGGGFMFVEMWAMQRLSIFLGHPVYSLTVVLFSFLLGAGIGSYVDAKLRFKSMPFRMLLIIAGLITLGLTIRAVSLPEHPALRNTLAAFMILPVAAAMGTAFPAGIRQAHEYKLDRLIPWFWALNGAASVAVSITSVLIAVKFGISWLLPAGTSCYLGCLLCSQFLSSRNR